MRWGDPLFNKYNQTLEERILYKRVIDHATECWVWTGGTTNGGYGIVRFNGENVRVHRASWSIYRSPVSDEVKVLHKCDNPPCFNPEHLFIGTQSDNVADMIAKGRRVQGIMPKGEKHFAALFSNTDIISIRSRLAAGEYGTVIAREYGVSPSTISCIRKEKTWQHLV